MINLKSLRGQWKTDHIKNGVGSNDLLLTVPEAGRPDEGFFVAVNGRKAYCGTYKGAFPEVTDALFTPVWQHEFKTHQQAVNYVKEKTR